MQFMTRLKISISNLKWVGLEAVCYLKFFKILYEIKKNEINRIKMKNLATDGKFQFVPKAVFDEAESYAKVNSKD